LEVYPDEAVASNRWRKIAKALGGRTPKQVASRTQKYFIKLAKQGKPVPGKIPNLEYYMNKEKNKKKRKKEEGDLTPRPHKKRELDPSYYMPPPVYMSDDEEEITALKLEQMDPELKETEEFKELMQLLQLKQLQEKKSENEHILNTEGKEKELVHEGYRCDCCGVEPIVGVRWKCSSCPEDHQVDLCSTCKENNFISETHKVTHALTKIDKVESIPYYLDYNHE